MAETPDGTPAPPLPVSVLPGVGSAESYRDGGEAALLALFEDGDEAATRERIRSLLAGTPTWPERVHLSPQRWHLLDWFPFSPQATLLEVGAGCGALTGLFLERVAHVEALETSRPRAEVVARRFRRASNLTVTAGDLATLADRGPRYDYVTLVGVLEYAGRFDPGGALLDPHRRLLDAARRVTAPGGTLLVAIENQMGLKYLAGYREDHLGRPLAGIEDYLVGDGVRTFGRTELQRLLEGAGFSVERWYQPFPDYKLPTSVYSDDQPLGSLEHVSVLFPTVDYSAPSDHYFSESRFAGVLRRNDLLSAFANSHLAVCRPSA